VPALPIFCVTDSVSAAWNAHPVTTTLLAPAALAVKLTGASLGLYVAGPVTRSFGGAPIVTGADAESPAPDAGDVYAHIVPLLTGAYRHTAAPAAHGSARSVVLSAPRHRHRAADPGAPSTCGVNVTVSAGVICDLSAVTAKLL